MKLSRMVSGYIVRELSIVLGQTRAQRVLAVDDSRFKAFLGGRACLSIDQLEQITKKSGKAWENWIVDAGGRGVKTEKGRAFIAKAHQMWDEILGTEKSAPPRTTTRRSKASLRPTA